MEYPSTPRFKKQEEIAGWLLDKMSSRERRRESRYKNVDIKGWYKEKSDDDFMKSIPSSGYTLVPIRILDISETGAAVRCARLAQPGQKVQLNLKLGDDSSEESIITILCEVLRCINNRDVIGYDSFHVGLRFTKMEPETKRRLMTFLRKSNEERAT